MNKICIKDCVTGKLSNLFAEWPTCYTVADFFLIKLNLGTFFYFLLKVKNSFLWPVTLKLKYSANSRLKYWRYILKMCRTGGWIIVKKLNLLPICLRWHTVTYCCEKSSNLLKRFRLTTLPSQSIERFCLCRKKEIQFFTVSWQIFTKIQTSF